MRAQHAIVNANVYRNSSINCMMHSKIMSSDSSCTLYSRLITGISDINNDITTHTSLLLHELSIKSSDIYRISPNTLSSFER